MRPLAAGRAIAVAFVASVFLVSAGCQPTNRVDPIAAEIARWTRFVATDTSSNELRAQVRASAIPALASAESALVHGRRLLALQRLGGARTNLAAMRHAQDPTKPPPEDSAGFEAEWVRVGLEVPATKKTPGSGELASIQPAAVRAMAEAAAPQVRVFYESSIEYGRNTAPFNGRFYIGAAQAQAEFIALCRNLGERSAGRGPELRPIGAELDSLEREMLLAYRPPLSIDRHPEFISASSLLKEARELDQAGLRHGAMLRYLQASLRFAPLRAAATGEDSIRMASPAQSMSERMVAAEGRITGSEGVDHSIARLFYEIAEADLDTVDAARARIAEAVVTDIVPRYFAALEPAPADTSQAQPRVTVTLVRWPYT